MLKLWSQKRYLAIAQILIPCKMKCKLGPMLPCCTQSRGVGGGRRFLDAIKTLFSKLK